MFGTDRLKGYDHHGFSKKNISVSFLQGLRCCLFVREPNEGLSFHAALPHQADVKPRGQENESENRHGDQTNGNVAIAEQKQLRDLMSTLSPRAPNIVSVVSSKTEPMSRQ